MITCEQLRKITSKSPHDCSLAEWTAVQNHRSGCKECDLFLEKRHDDSMKEIIREYGPVRGSLLYLLAIGEAQSIHKRASADPECLHQQKEEEHKSIKEAIEFLEEPCVDRPFSPLEALRKKGRSAEFGIEHGINTLSVVKKIFDALGNKYEVHRIDVLIAQMSTPEFLHYLKERLGE